MPGEACVVCVPARAAWGAAVPGWRLRGAGLLVAAPVAGGVLVLVIRVTRAALKEGWLAEI